MKKMYTKPNLSKEQKERLKMLFVRNNYTSFISMLQDVLWISFAIFISTKISLLFYPLSILIIGARQRAIATLFHDVAHETLFYLNF